ncbi:3-methylornithine--L-lysine ligase PylC [Acetobacterium sp.]|uniref:3-methylornithine--L-lysine ligase PylC n=1 Tax=Acetobacterium sp. TaxID=1872094 RepID=UPI00359432AF
MKILIVGGKLQGVEAAYLARKAGWSSILVDKNDQAPAAKICDKFLCTDATNEELMIQLFHKVDLVIPAMENSAVLEKLLAYKETTGTPLVYDQNAYDIASSKIKSDRIFRTKKIPAPRYYPTCNYPVIVKPSNRSGSEGVVKINSRKALEEKAEYFNGTYVIQEYLDGRSYSVEVVGNGMEYNILQVTEIIIDDDYDCKRVVAPAAISNNLENELCIIAQQIAEILKIRGMFDIEVILHNGQFKVLEIDARLPSQTPIAVYHSTGINMLELMAEAVLQQVKKVEVISQRVCLYQQIAVNAQGCTVLGEKIMGTGGPLELIEGLFGADEAITNYDQDKKDWVATIIVTALTEKNAYLKFDRVLTNITNQIAADNLLTEALQ